MNDDDRICPDCARDASEGATWNPKQKRSDCDDCHREKVNAWSAAMRCRRNVQRTESYADPLLVKFCHAVARV